MRILSLIFMLAIVGCGEDDGESVEPTPNPVSTATEQTDTLVQKCQAYCKAEQEFLDCQVTGGWCHAPSKPSFCVGCEESGK